MNISNNWLKEFIDFEYSPTEIDAILTGLGIEVEHIIDNSSKYKNFFIGEVLTKEKHPNADKLSLCTVDYGQGIKNIVCGAPNVEAGQKVVVAALGAVVPNGGFVIEKRAVRKIDSEGMICSVSELDLPGDGHGILVLPADSVVGTELADFLNVNDIIYEISVTPNRADCLSHLGIAREISAYSGKPIKLPEININKDVSSEQDNFSVEILNPEKCPRYTARIIKNVTIKESPDWLKNRLNILGLRPINNVVDITNLVLMECGQPLHAFDLNKLAGRKIVVKTANESEKFISLDGKERILDNSMLMICDGDKPVAIGGVMGGENSEITNETTDILLESAYFDPSSVRRTSKKLALQSDSSYRFERGVDINNVVFASNRATELIVELTGAKSVSNLIDVYPVPIANKQVELRFKRVRDIIGIDITNEQIRDLLIRLSFKIIDENPDSVHLEIPSYRVDISLEIDLIEEIARLYDYDNIIPDFSVLIDSSNLQPLGNLSVPNLRTEFRNYLVNNGYHEILTQNMIDVKSSKIFTENPVVISNPLGEELSIMRPSPVISMLKTIERNLRLGNKNLRLFELGKSFSHDSDSNYNFIDGLYEKEELIIALVGNENPMQWGIQESKYDFYSAKGLLQNLISYYKFKDIEFSENDTNNVVFSKNSQKVICKGKTIGFVGEVNPDILTKFDLSQPVFLINLDLHILYQVDRKSWQYKQVSPYPGISRDIALLIERNIPALDLQNDILKNGGSFLRSVFPFDEYKGKNISPDKKSIAFSLSFQSDDRTLSINEVDESVNKIIKSLETNYNAELRKF